MVSHVRKVSIQDKPRFIKDQFTDSIGSYTYYYNPMGYGGVTVIDSDTGKSIALCDGKLTVQDISRSTHKPLSTTLQEIQDLTEQEVVEISPEFTKQLHQSQKKKKMLSCWLHITNSCNLRCPYCYVHKSPGNMSFETAKLAIDRMVESCKQHDLRGIDIKFAGGEPLLRFDFIKQIVDYTQQFVDEVEISYTVVTNGTLITKDISQYLKKNNINVGVSLDGIGEIHNLTRFYQDKQGSYEKVIEGLQILKNFHNRVGIMTTISNLNYEHLLGVVEFCFDNEYNFRLSLQKDCESGWPELLNHIPKLIQQLHLCYDYMEQNIPQKNFFYAHKFGDVTFMRPVYQCCNAGNGFFAIGYDGQIGVCGMGLINSLKLDLKKCHDIFADVKMRNPLPAKTISKSCDYCTWRTSCAGSCPLQASSSLKLYGIATPYCQVYQEILPRVLRIKAMQMIRNHELNT